jgi:hypothetical protein
MLLASALARWVLRAHLMPGVKNLPLAAMSNIEMAAYASEMKAITTVLPLLFTMQEVRDNEKEFTFTPFSRLYACRL